MPNRPTENHDRRETHLETTPADQKKIMMGETHLETATIVTDQQKVIKIDVQLPDSTKQLFDNTAITMPKPRPSHKRLRSISMGENKGYQAFDDDDDDDKGGPKKDAQTPLFHAKGISGVGGGPAPPGGVASINNDGTAPEPGFDEDSGTRSLLPGNRNSMEGSGSHNSTPDLVMPANNHSHKDLCSSFRLKVALICMLGFVCSFMSQSILGASFLSMVRYPANHTYNANGTFIFHPLFASHSHRNRFWGKGRSGYLDIKDDDSEGDMGVDDKWVPWSQWKFDWSNEEQDFILVAFFVGYYISQIPVGCLTRRTRCGCMTCLAKRTGPRHIILFGSVGLIVLQLAAIPAAHVGAYCFMSVMTLSGILNGCLYVPMMDLLSRWSPPEQNSELATLVVSGLGPGIALIYGISAGCTYIPLIGGWPFSFIIFAGFLLAFTVLFAVFVTDRPQGNRWISSGERDYIQNRIRAHLDQNQLHEETDTSTPWCEIALSKPVLAIAASQFATDWIQYFCITFFPLYLKRARGMSSDRADMIAGLPWLLFPFVGYGISAVVDNVRGKRPPHDYEFTTRIRKIADFVAKFGPMTFLIGIVYLPDGAPWWIILAMYIGIIITVSAESSSWVPNILDITSEYAASVSSYCQVISLLGSFLLPIAVDLMTTENSADQWRMCMWIMLAIVAVSYAVYVYWGSSAPQRWDSSRRSCQCCSPCCCRQRDHAALVDENNENYENDDRA